MVMPVTVAVSCTLFPAATVADAGATLTETVVGTRFTVAVPDFVASTTLVAITVIVCAVVMVAGAVYSPDAEIVPTAGDKLHVTFLFAAPVTLAVKFCVCPAFTLIDDGETVTFTRPRRIVWLAACPTEAAMNSAKTVVKKHTFFRNAGNILIAVFWIMRVPFRAAGWRCFRE